MKRMLVAISYDIADDRRRTAVLNRLKDVGRHVQYSVFECELSDRQLARLQQELAAYVRSRTDSIRYYRLCDRCRARLPERADS